MMIFGKTKPRPIADFDFNVTDDWYPVDLAPESRSQWPRETAQEAVPSREGREVVTGELAVLHERLLGIDDPGLTAAVWIPDEEPAYVKCVLTFRVSEIESGETPESYEASLGSDENRRAPGEDYNIVKTWMAQIDAGIAVGAYNLITYTDPGEEYGHPEARTIIAVFPKGAAQKLEFIFTTQNIATFDDLVELSMGCVASTTVQLGR
jgi:hypothetical protein